MNEDEDSEVRWFRTPLPVPNINPPPPLELIHVAALAADLMKNLIDAHGIDDDGTATNPPQSMLAGRLLLEFLGQIGDFIHADGYTHLVKQAYGDIPCTLPYRMVQALFSGQVRPTEEVLRFCLFRIGCASKVVTAAALFLHYANNPTTRHINNPAPQPSTSAIRRAVMGTDRGGIDARR